MEEPWQQRKCGSVLHSTTPYFSASAPLEWRPQVLTAGHLFYPCVSQGPTSLLYDLQMLSNPNSILTSNKGPMNLTSTSVSAGQLSQYLNSHKFNGGASIYTLSKPTVSFMCSSSSVPNDVLQAVGINPLKPELGTQTMTSHYAVHEKLEDSYVLRGAQISLPVTNSVMEFNNNTNTGTSANVCTAPRFSSDQLSSLSSSCPHVFCLGISGYLLLSNTGLFGIVCSCHGLHMSVSKFSEHSGLSHVNPGNAVRVDSGESITQWRKAFFQRLGARAPEDDSGWDWPEGFSATVGLEKHNAFMSYLPVKSDLPNRFGASGESWNNVSLPKDPNSYKNMVDKQLHTVKQRTSQENIFTGFIHTSHSILNPVPDYNISGCSTMSNFNGKRGPDSASQAISAFIGSSSKSENTFMSVPDMQNLKARVGGVDQEKVSSNFELRLGQPSQQSWTLGTSPQPTFRSNQANTCLVPLVPQKSEFPDQLLTRDSRIIEERRQVHFADSMLYASAKKGKNLLDLVEFACEAHSATGAHSEQFKDDMPRASVFPIFYSHFKGPEEKSYSKSSYDVFNGSHTLSRELPCEFLITKSEKSKLPCIRGDMTEKEHDLYFLGNQGHGKNNKELGNMITNLRCTSEFKCGQHTKFNENQATFNGEMCRISHINCSALLDNSHFICLDGQQKGFNNSKNTSCGAHNGDSDHGYLTPTDSRTIISSQTVPLRLALTDSSVIQTQTQTLSSKERTLDGNVRLSASQNMFDFSTEGCGIALPTPVQEQVILGDLCEKLSTLASLASEELSFGLNFANMQNTSSVATSSLFTCTNHPTGKDNETMASLTALSQGRFLVKDPEAQCHLPNHHSIDWPSLSKSSLGGVERKVLHVEQGKCCQRVLSKPVILGKCDCGVQTNTSASMKKNLLPSRLDKNYNFAEKTTSLGENGMKKVESHFFQWRDVPRKVMGTCTSTCKDKSSGVLNRFDNIEGNQSVDAGADIPRYCRKSDEDPVSFNEPSISNISFGGSLPVITQVSITTPNKELSTADADDAHCASNVVVDEGSGIDRCSDDSIGSEKSAELSDFASKINLLDKGPPEEFAQKSSRSLIDELRIRDSLLKKGKNQNHASFSIQENFNNIQKFEKSPNKVIGKRTLKWKKLNSAFPSSALLSTSHGCPDCVCGAAFYSQSCKDKEDPFRCDQHNSNDCTCYIEPNFKRKFGMPSSVTLTWKRDSDNICFHETKNFDTETNQLKVDDDESLGTLEESKRKRLKVETTAPTIKQMIHGPFIAVSGTTAKPSTLGCSKILDSHESSCKQMIKPIICGKYGIISNGNQSKPIKIVCLRNIRDTMRKHHSTGKVKTKITQNGIKGRDQCFKKSSNVKKVANCYPDKFAALKYHEDCHELSGGLDPCYLMEHTEKGYFNEGDASVSLPYSLRKRSYDCLGKNGYVTNSPQTWKKQKCKETRKRSIYELTIKDSRDVAELKENAKDSGGNTSEIYDKSRLKDCQLQYQPRQNIDGVCCVCGSNNNDESNCLLECHRCSIKVHQACYGICKVPKAHWYCRPCRKNAKNIVCVLCGYSGGAMTQALRWHNIAKSLLQAWNIDVDFKPRSSSFAKLEELNTFTFTNYKPRGDTFPVNPLPQESSFVAVSDVCISKPINVGNSSPCHSMVENSITAGVHDSTVKQWVHMVCGLWTPGTRCPNVDTMSAFDVSGASHYKDEVCSLCNRPGGCCIQCRVIYCSESFHPWCAHQKGLLQSEVEGFENESVGFYGTCMLHASYQQCVSISNPIDTESIHLVENDSICARSEGYKGRKQEGVRYNPPSADCNGGCLVPQEQLNAWLHINGQKSCTKGLPRFPMKDSEYDYRKEYAHYKQSKGWKGLVVYKSGIHALGLYTSHFISQGKMVVEYVGEVVGVRVADKRENEYLSGKKLQYRSACYFFRIDKEHIIDATRKGGIARFVNHSCRPNCVARVISVRNEKKVVFFAERDIYPGEEITYDYHFNHEDEGKKLPCYCNSKNCRRYLN